MFAATHNSMSSPLYADWLFGEQIGPIGDQLNSRIRALLFDRTTDPVAPACPARRRSC